MRLFSLLLIAFVLEWYTTRAFKTLFNDAKWVNYYWIIAIIFPFLIEFLTKYFFEHREGNTQRIGFTVTLFLLWYVPKLVLAFPLIIEDFFRVFGYLIGRIQGHDELAFPTRRKFISQLAFGLASIPFVGIIYAVIKGKYNFKIHKADVFFDDLPTAFDGYKILQISDVHSGSFDNKKMVEYGIQLINEQDVDVIFFTGDLVNSVANEMEPWVESFAKIKRAPDGNYSITGNHDYGDYADLTPEEHEANFQEFLKMHDRIGMKILMNENVTVDRNGEKLHIVGVENWGYPPFKQYGDLQKALEGLGDNDFKVLLSHDPSHFDGQVKMNNSMIHLTLSGHTHGMQFGIEIPGWFKWSPVKFRYPKWAGLYQENGRFLYVNRGFGYLAFPGRLGIWPEITVLTLKKNA